MFDISMLDNPENQEMVAVSYKGREVSVSQKIQSMLRLLTEVLDKDIEEVAELAFQSYLKNTDPWSVRMNFSVAITMGTRYLFQENLTKINELLQQNGLASLPEEDAKQYDWFSNVNEFLMKQED